MEQIKKDITEKCKGCYAESDCLFTSELRKCCNGPFASVESHMKIIRSCLEKTNDDKSS